MQALRNDFHEGGLLAALRVALLYPEDVLVPGVEWVVASVVPNLFLELEALIQNLLLDFVMRFGVERLLQPLRITTTRQRLDILFGVVEVHFKITI